MKSIAVCILLLVVQLAHGSTELGPIPFSVRVDLEKPEWQCKAAGKSCRNCGTLQSCSAAGAEPEFVLSCKDQYPLKPYCDPVKGECVADKASCDGVPNGFKCPKKGMYPDLTDCTRYIECAAEGDEGVLYACLYKSVYNHRNSRCITGAPCYTVTADCKQQYKAIPYKNDNSLIVICQGTEPPLLKTCPNKNYAFNPTSLQCDFRCPEEGNFANPLDPTKYFRCTRNGSVLVHNEVTCKTGTKFDENDGQCVKSDEPSSPGGDEPSSPGNEPETE